MKRMVDDTECIAEWRKLLKVFKMITDPNPDPESVREPLEKLKESAKTSPHLTYHQVSGITERCNNYLNGTYGRTKTTENLDQNYKATPVGKEQQNGKH